MPRPDRERPTLVFDASGEGPNSKFRNLAPGEHSDLAFFGSS
jgi:hypothetical protein